MEISIPRETAPAKRFKYPKYTGSKNLPPAKKSGQGVRGISPGDPQYFVTRERTQKGERLKLIEVRRTAAGVKRRHVYTFDPASKVPNVISLIRNLKESEVM